MRAFWLLMPTLGSLLYLLLYLIATLFYPGGSSVDKDARGFSWMHNYWCNLMDANALNGQPNTARPIAFTAMVVLCFTLMQFWYLSPKQIGFTKRRRLVIQVCGCLAMIIAMALFTKLHDAVINVATLLGMVALVGIFAGLYQLKWIKLFWMGLFTFVLIALNNLFYYGPGLMQYLPVVQKITFLYFLLWICFINTMLYKRDRAMLDKQ